jgi:acyl-CoA thioesterase
MLFSEVLESLAPREHEQATSVPADWMQGRSVYGGLQTALAVRAMRTLVPAGFPLRSVQTTFVGPVEGAIRLRVNLLRTGKNVIHAEARMLTGDQTAMVVVGVFGRSRASRAEVPAEAPSFVATYEPLDLPYVDGVSPAFAQHFSFRWLAGALPFTNTSAREARRAVLDVGVRDRGPTTEEHLIALADAPPPLGLAMLSDFAPGSSVTWTMQFLLDGLADLPLTGWRLHAALRAGHGGYTNQEVTLCTPSGVPAAFSYQTMMVFG